MPRQRAACRPGRQAGARRRPQRAPRTCSPPRRLPRPANTVNRPPSLPRTSQTPPLRSSSSPSLSHAMADAIAATPSSSHALRQPHAAPPCPGAPPPSSPSSKPSPERSQRPSPPHRPRPSSPSPEIPFNAVVAPVHPRPHQGLRRTHCELGHLPPPSFLAPEPCSDLPELNRTHRRGARRRHAPGHPPTTPRCPSCSPRHVAPN